MTCGEPFSLFVQPPFAALLGRSCRESKKPGLWRTQALVGLVQSNQTRRGHGTSCFILEHPASKNLFGTSPPKECWAFFSPCICQDKLKRFDRFWDVRFSGLWLFQSSIQYFETFRARGVSSKPRRLYVYIYIYMTKRMDVFLVLAHFGQLRASCHLCPTACVGSGILLRIPAEGRAPTDVSHRGMSNWGYFWSGVLQGHLASPEVQKWLTQDKQLFGR